MTRTYKPFNQLPATIANVLRAEILGALSEALSWRYQIRLAGTGPDDADYVRSWRTDADRALGRAVGLIQAYSIPAAHTRRLFADLDAELTRALNDFPDADSANAHLFALLPQPAKDTSRD